MSLPDWKPAARIVDRDVLRAARLRYRNGCAACGRETASVHHVIPKGERGDDVLANLIGLCGHGTAGCHGAMHGNPYTVRAPVVRVRPMRDDYLVERRDHLWVASRIGAHIGVERPDTVEYVLDKLGEDAGVAYLERNYLLVIAAGSDIRRCGPPV